MSALDRLQKPCGTEANLRIESVISQNHVWRQYLFSKMISPPSSATKESNATVVRVRTEPGWELPITGFDDGSTSRTIGLLRSLYLIYNLTMQRYRRSTTWKSGKAQHL